MGWYVELLDRDGKVVKVARHAEGGTYAVGGRTEAVLSVTYNYSQHFAAAMDGLGFREALNGKRARDVIPLLEGAVLRLGVCRDGSYWAATEGNAGHALSVLLAWARQHPDAVFEVD